MRKKIMNFAAVAAILFLGACSNEDLLQENNPEVTPETERTITITASMPDEGPDTRVALDRDEKNIKLTWQSGDRLQFAIVQGSTEVKRILELSTGNISNEGKTVNFTIALPADEGFDQDADFDLYGLYSNYLESGLIDENNPTNVVLTKTPGSRGTLVGVQNRGDVMLYFKETGINRTNLPESVTFKHIGSLFAINFNNTVAPSATAGITEARLIGVNTDGTPLTGGNWAYNNETGGQIFDMKTEQFQNTDSGGNYISFSTVGSSWTVGQTTTLWGWYPPIPEQEWPALRLQMTIANGTVALLSTNIKPARQAAPEAGKVYHFYARWNGTNLVFTDDTFLVPSPAL